MQVHKFLAVGTACAVLGGGGIATAATTGLINGHNIKHGTVTSAQIKDLSLHAKDFDKVQRALKLRARSRAASPDSTGPRARLALRATPTTARRSDNRRRPGAGRKTASPRSSSLPVSGTRERQWHRHRHPPMRDLTMTDGTSVPVHVDHGQQGKATRVLGQPRHPRRSGTKPPPRSVDPVAQGR